MGRPVDGARSNMSMHKKLEGSFRDPENLKI